MLKILDESPIESNGTIIGFERNPSIFALADLKYENPVYAGFFRMDELLGFGLAGLYRAYVNGEPETVCHGTQFHVKAEGRQKGFYYRASRLLFGELARDARIGYFLVMIGNRHGESLISRRHERYPDVPYTRVVNTAEARNIVVLFRKKETAEYRVRHATDTDIEEIVELLQRDFSERLFAPYITREEFVKNLGRRPDFGISNYYVVEIEGRIAGVCAAWDCSSFKQLRVKRYGGRMKLVKKLLDIMALLNIVPRLPDENQVFKEVYITEFAVRDRNPLIMRALLTRIYNEYRIRKYNLIVFGSCKNDPLLQAVKGFMHVPVQSSIVLCSRDRTLLEDGAIDTSLPYIDFALL